MAWYVQRYSEFQDDNGTHYQIEILSETYNISPDEFKVGADGFTLTYSGSGKDIDDPIKSSECQFTFYSESSTDDSFFFDIMNAEVGKYLVKICRNLNGSIGVVPFVPESYIWKGILVLQETALADDHYPQAFNMRAIDGLSLLKGFKINELTNIKDAANNATDSNFAVGVNGAMSGSWYNHQSIVFAILRLLPTANSSFFYDNYPGVEFVITYFNWWSDRTFYEEDDAFYNPMLFTFARSDCYYSVGNEPGNSSIRYMTAYDVLKSILEFYNARISMSDGTWQIQQLCAMAVCAAAGTPGPTIKAAKFNMDSTHYSLGSPFDAVLNRGDLDPDYKAQRAEVMFTFSPGTRDVVLTIEDGANLLYGPGEEFASAEYDYAVIGQSLLGVDNSATQTYTNTYVGGSAGDLITFVMDMGILITPDLTGTAWSNMDADSVYLLEIQPFVRQDDYWLVFNAATNKYEWETTHQQVYSNNQFTWFEPLNAGMGAQLLSLSLGSNTLDGMEELPSNGAIKYHVCYRVIKIAPDGTTSDATAIGFQSTNSIEVKLVLDQQGQYGAPENFVSLGFKLFMNGENYDQNIYFFEQNASSPTISGSHIEKKSMFFDGPAIFRKNNIFYQNNSGFLGMFQWGLSGSWYYRNNAGISHLLAQVIKGDEYLRLTNRQRIILTGKILHQLTPRPNPSPLQFYEIYRENITGFGDVYFLFNGGKFTARSVEWSGEWRSLEMTFIATDGKLIGDKIDHHNITNLITNNLHILEHDNKGKK